MKSHHLFDQKYSVILLQFNIVVHILLLFTHRHIILNLCDVIFSVKHESKHNVKALISAYTTVNNLGFGLFCSATLHLYDQKHIQKYEILSSCKIAVFCVNMC